MASAPCCCGVACPNCPDGGTLPDSFHLVLAGFEPYFPEFNGTWLCNRQSGPFVLPYGTTTQWWTTDRLFTTLASPLFPSGRPVVIACGSTDSSGLNVPFSGAGFYMAAKSGETVLGWQATAPAFSGLSHTYACNPPDVRYLRGAFQGQMPFPIGPVPLPNAAANIVA